MPNPSSMFAAEAGLVSPLRVTFTHRTRGDTGTVELVEPFAILGRHARCSVRLVDPSVSRRHAFLLVLAGHVFALDLNSRRGLQVGGAYASQVWLPAGQPLRVGEFDVHVLAEPGPTAKPPGRWVGPPLALLSSESSTVYPLRSAVSVIGRDVSTNLVINDDRLDPLHAVVVQTSTSVWVVSLGGSGGVRVNGRQVRAARVKVGDQLDMNGILLKVVPDSMADNAKAGLLVSASAGRTEPADDVREMTLALAKMFSTFQQEQTELLRRQTELLQVIADTLQRGKPALTGGEVAAPDGDFAANGQSVDAPIPQPSLPREAEVLEEAHSWLMERLRSMKNHKP